MEHPKKDGPDRKDAPRAAKRPYARPELSVHGDVERITRVLGLARVHGQVATVDTFFAQ